MIELQRTNNEILVAKIMLIFMICFLLRTFMLSCVAQAHYLIPQCSQENSETQESVAGVNILMPLETLANLMINNQEETETQKEVTDEAITETITETTVIEEEEEVIDETIIPITEEEFQDFCMLVFAEAGGDCLEGQIAVAAVIINRILSPSFPDTFYEVINQRGQFSTVDNGRICSSISSYEDLPEKVIEAVKRALDGEDPTEEQLYNEAARLGLNAEKYAEGGAYFFYYPGRCSESALESRENIKVKCEIGEHTFYKVWDS